MTVARALPADAVLGAVLDMSLPCLVDAHPRPVLGYTSRSRCQLIASIHVPRGGCCLSMIRRGAVAQVAQSADYGAGKGPWAGLPSLRPRCRATALVSMRSEFVVPSDRSGRLVDQRFG